MCIAVYIVCIALSIPTLHCQGCLCHSGHLDTVPMDSCPVVCPVVSSRWHDIVTRWHSRVCEPYHRHSIYCPSFTLFCALLDTLRLSRENANSRERLENESLLQLFLKKKKKLALRQPLVWNDGYLEHESMLKKTCRFSQFFYSTWELLFHA